MNLRNTLLSILFFSLQFSSYSLEAINLDCPVSGFGITAVEGVTQVAGSAVQAVGNSFVAELSKDFLRACVPLLPKAIGAAIVVYFAKKGVDKCFDGFQKFASYVKNLFHMPSTTHETHENVKSIDEKLTSHIRDFTTKITALGGKFELLKQFIEDFFALFEQRQEKANEDLKQEVKELIVDNSAEVLCAIENSEKNQSVQALDIAIQHEERDLENLVLLDARLTEHEKILKIISDALIDLNCRLESVPNDMAEVRDAQGALLEQNEQITETTTQTHSAVLSVTGTFSNVRNKAQGLHGSGIFSELIRPRLDEITQKQAELEAMLRKSHEGHDERALDKTYADQQLSDAVVVAVKKELQPLLQALKQETFEKQLLQKQLAQVNALCCVLMMAAQQNSISAKKTPVVQNFAYVQRPGVLAWQNNNSEQYD